MALGLLNRVTDTLSWLGLRRRQAKLLILGLDNAGKSTLFTRLIDDTLHKHGPTNCLNYQSLIISDTFCKTFDVGGSCQARLLWMNYLAGVSGIVFVVDTSDTARFAEAKAEIGSLLAVEELDKIPFLVLGNKIDTPGAVSEQDLRDALGLTNQPYTKSGPVEVYMCSVLAGQGYGCGLLWLVHRLWTPAEAMGRKFLGED